MGNPAVNIMHCTLRRTWFLLGGSSWPHKLVSTSPQPPPRICDTPSLLHRVFTPSGFTPSSHHTPTTRLSHAYHTPVTRLSHAHHTPTTRRSHAYQKLCIRCEAIRLSHHTFSIRFAYALHIHNKFNLSIHTLRHA